MTEVEQLRALPEGQRRLALCVGAKMCAAWEALQPMTIAAIEGHCIGGGLALAVSTDLRVISSKTRLSAPEVARGLNMSWGSVPRITNLIGPARAKRMIALAEEIDADALVDYLLNGEGGSSLSFGIDGESLNVYIDSDAELTEDDFIF